MIVIDEENCENVAKAIKHKIIPAIFVLLNSISFLLIHSSAPTIKIKKTSTLSGVGLFNAGVFATNVVLEDDMKLPIFNR